MARGKKPAVKDSEPKEPTARARLSDTTRASLKALPSASDQKQPEAKDDISKENRAAILERIVTLQSGIMGDLKKEVLNYKAMFPEKVKVQIVMRDLNETDPEESFDDDPVKSIIKKLPDTPVDPPKTLKHRVVASYQLLVFTLALMVRTLLYGERNNALCRTGRDAQLIRNKLEASSFPICGVETTSLSKRIKSCVKSDGRRLQITSGNATYVVDPNELAKLECFSCARDEDTDRERTRTGSDEDESANLYKLITIFTQASCSKCLADPRTIVPLLWSMRFPHKNKSDLKGINLETGVLRIVTNDQAKFRNGNNYPVMVRPIRGLRFHEFRLAAEEAKEVKLSFSKAVVCLAEIEVAHCDPEGRRIVIEFAMIYSE